MAFALLVVVTFVVAVAAATRSTWSPCGLSMLSMITPLSESARGHRYGVTVAWFVLGALLGGATLGIVAATAAGVVGALAMPATTLVAVAAALAVVALASDLRAGGFALPGHRRQVDEVWLTGFRPWVYGIGFGWQIGVGLATYIVTAGVYLVVALAVLTGSPAVAVATGLVFGGVRGLAVLLGVGLVSPEALRRFHLRFEALGPASARVMSGVLAASALALSAATSPVALVLAAVAVGAVLLLARRGPSRRARAALAAPRTPAAA